MTRVLADTAFCIALLNPRDNLHAIAHEIIHARHLHITTTEYILVELASHLSQPENRVMYSQFVKTLESQSTTTIQCASTELFHQGMKLYAQRPDKDWSLVDCISFVIMKQERIQEALTSDHHFTQAGFKILMNS